MTAPPTAALLHSRLAGPGLMRALAYFAVRPPDQADFAAAADAVRHDAGLLQRVAETVARLRAGMGAFLSEQQAMLPPVFDPPDPTAALTARFFYPVVFAAALPDTLAYHRTRAIPDSASRAIFADLGRHLRIFHTTFGHGGLHVQNWFSRHLRGMIYDFGRLQAGLETLDFPEPVLRRAGVPLGAGCVVAGIHVPDSGPLVPGAVDASLARIRPFFARHFPELPPLTTASCTSWLLDEQLRTLVPASNIAQFGARWRPIGAPSDGDESVRNFVFRRPHAEPADLSATTRLERALLATWRTGGHLHQRSGWLPLPSPLPPRS